MPYQSHIDRCKAASLSHEASYLRACFLAVTSIQIQSNRYWLNLAEVYADASRNGIDDASVRWGMFLYAQKRRTLKALTDNVTTFQRLAREADTADYHDALCKVPGIAAVKAGFVVQLTTGNLGCLDTVHVNRLGYDRKTWANMQRRKNAPAQYRNLLKENGESSVELWRVWCEMVAMRDSIYTPECLSEAHATFVETGSTDTLLTPTNNEREDTIRQSEPILYGAT